MKELEVNVAASAPDKNQQKQMEKSVEVFRKGMGFCIASNYGPSFIDK